MVVFRGQCLCPIVAEQHGALTPINTLLWPQGAIRAASHLQATLQNRQFHGYSQSRLQLELNNFKKQFRFLEGYIRQIVIIFLQSAPS